MAYQTVSSASGIGRSGKKAGGAISSITVTPSVGEFSDVEPGMVFVIPFTIHNVSNSVKRVRFGPPKTNAFRLINTQQSIAPGMKQVVEVEFTSKEVKDYHDSLTVRTEEGEISIPLHAWFPAPKLVFDAVVDLGRVSSQHPVESKKFRIRNIGKKDGNFKFVTETHAQGLSLTPQSGSINPGQEIEVAVHYFPTEVGLFRSVVNVQVDGDATRRLEVVAEVTESRVEILHQQYLEPISRVTFGKLFFGQTRTVTVLLRNYGQHTVSFTVRPPEDPSGTSTDDENRQAIPLECRPTEGRIAGNDTFPLTFTFSPFVQESTRGWEHAMLKGEDLTREWDVPFVVEIVETEQKRELQLVGKALPTEVRLSDTVFRFPECPVNDHRDVLFNFVNESAELPITFDLSRVAHFKCEPSKGKVVPKAQQNILLTFHPNQLGAFRGNINLSINGGSKLFPLSVVGNATAIGPRPPPVGGVDKTSEDFEHVRKFAQPSSQPRLKFLKQKKSDDEEVPDWVDEDNPTDLLLMSEWQQKREHSRLYNNFLTNSRNIRAYNDKMKKGLMLDTNPDDIGMIPGEGLEEPVPPKPKREDPLYWAGDMHSDSAAVGGKKGDNQLALRKIKVDENKQIKKKFRKEPNSLNEVRECKLVLSPKDIQNIMIPVKVLDFQQVNVLSTNTKSFFVYNGLKTHILVNIPLSIRDEFALSHPTSQVIPPSQLAGFDIVFRSESVQTFKQAIYFTINDTHKLKFVVFAEVIPIDLQMSHSELVFRFQEFGYEASVTHQVILTNPGNSDAEFNWVLPENDPGAFAFSPSTGVVPANSTKTIDVSYTPILTSNETQCDAQLKVRGGAVTKKLHLSGSVQNAQCSWNVKDGRLDFRKVPVGSTKTQTITLKNTHSTNAVFSFDTTQLSNCISLNPLRGRIAPGGSEDVQVQFRASSAQTVKSMLTCHVRGMRQLLKCSINAEAKVPDFYIAEPAESSTAESQLVFGGVYVGSSEMRKIVLQSHDDVVASFIVDLTQFPAFTLCDQDRRPIEQTATDDEEVPAGLPGQVVLWRPNSEDDEANLDADTENGSGRKGSIYRVTVCPQQVMTIYLCFTPQSVGIIDPPFALPMSLAGSDVTSPSLRPILVSAEGKKPRLVLTPTVLDFGSRVVIREGTSKVPNRMLVKLSNETDGELQWDLDTRGGEALGEVFRVEPTTGKLMPGQVSQVQFTFTPVEVRSYTARYSVYLDGNRESKYMDVVVKGFGSNPSLTFDRKEVIMPSVPLDVTSRMTFYIGNEGYEALDLRYKIAGDGKLPVSLNFPEAQAITSNHSLLPVEVTFCSKKPITFTVNIDFFDDADGIFSIPVTCCADNSLLTNFAYLKWRDSGVQVSAENDKKPLLLKELDETAVDKETPRGSKSAGESASTVAGGPADDQGGAFSAVDTVHKKALSVGKRAIDRLRLWLNVNILPEPVDDLVSALQQNNGRLLMDIIELLYGKSVPGANKGARQGSKKEASLQILEQLDNTLLFLKQFGACVSDVRSEYLLKYEDYCRLGGETAGTSNAKGGAASGNSKTVAPARARLSEKKFLFRASHAWSTVLFQLLRVFYFSRINWRAFKALPQNPVTQQYSSLEKWNAMSQEPSSVGSNLYSTSESLLLKWLSVHVTAVFGKPQTDAGKGPKDGALRRETTSTSSDLKEYVRISNFESDVRDCKAFVAVLISYIPTLAPRFDPTKDGGFVLQASTALDLERNASMLLEALKEYGMEVRWSPRDIHDFSGRDFLLFSAFLYNTLPQYVPKTSVKFKGKLLERITKTIELTNPTKYAIDYTVRLDGGGAQEEFRLPESKLHLEPKGTGNFAIQVTPRLMKKVESRVMFLSNRSGSYSAATMVFGLETEVDPDSAYRVFDNIESPMYEALNYEVQVENPYDSPGHFAVQIQQDHLPEANGKPFPEEESIRMFPEAFWSQTDTLQLKKKDKAKFVLQFLPCVRGRYKARVVFRDEKVGEFAYTFLATCTPPKPFDIQTMQTEGNQAVSREISVPLKHSVLEKALSQKDERIKMFKGARKATNQKEPESEGKEVTYRLEFLNEKFVGPNPFFSGPKTFTLKPPAEDDEAAAKKRRDGAKNDKGSTSQQLSINFHPKGPGQYTCCVMLVSTWDIRIFMVDAKSRSPGMKAELEFSCPARQQITQDIPITNSSEKEWVISAQVSGDAFQGPREVRVPPGRSKNYTLVFNPLWISDNNGQLLLKNNDTQEKYTYTLKGHADEPLAENTIPIECKARQLRKITINVPNITFDEVTYAVETDLPFVSGEPRLTVGKMEVGRYVLHINPQLSGKITGSVTFIAPNKQYVWFVVQVTVARPPPEDTIVVNAEVRKGVVCEIGMSNPKNRMVDFTVRRRGDGLHGDDIFTLEPNQQGALYQLAYAPTKAGEYEGSLSFNNDDLGEFWYKLQLIAKEAAPVNLSFHCELGKSSAQELVIENPTGSECVMTVQNTNDVNFSVTPNNLVLKPNASLKVTVTYMPSAISSPQEAIIKLAHPKAGVWEYRCKGTGQPPTKMETLNCVAHVNRTSSTSVNFRNPFPVPKRFLANLKPVGGPNSEAASVFQLMQKKQTAAVGPFQALQIPVAYTPTTIAEHRASVVVQLLEQQDGDLKWEFPILGTAESVSNDPATKLICKARKDIAQTLALPLVGLNTSVEAEDFSAELVIPEDADFRRAAVQSVQVNRADGDSYQGKELAENIQRVYYNIHFAPLRPFTMPAELIVKKSSGGMWKFPLQLEATAPEVDDVIVIEAAVNVVANVTFPLYNVLPQSKPFTAFFTPDSPQEFKVSPSKGTLPPIPSNLHEAKDAGQPITVGFTSSQYGKTLTGHLVVETEEMQWRYEVRGTLPKYQPPTNIKSKVNTNNAGTRNVSIRRY